MIFDVGNVLVNLWKIWKEDREWQAWIRLILSTIYSAIISFSFATGTAILSGKSGLLATGYGLLGLATGISATLLRSPQTRGMVFSLPTGAVDKNATAPNSQGTFTGPAK